MAHALRLSQETQQAALVERRVGIAGHAGAVEVQYEVDDQLGSEQEQHQWQNGPQDGFENDIALPREQQRDEIRAQEDRAHQQVAARCPQQQPFPPATHAGGIAAQQERTEPADDCQGGRLARAIHRGRLAPCRAQHPQADQGCIGGDQQRDQRHDPTLHEPHPLGGGAELALLGLVEHARLLPAGGEFFLLQLLAGFELASVKQQHRHQPDRQGSQQQPEGHLQASGGGHPPENHRGDGQDRLQGQSAQGDVFASFLIFHRMISLSIGPNRPAARLQATARALECRP